MDGAGLDDRDGSRRGGRPIRHFLIGDILRIRHVDDRECAGRGSSGQLAPPSRVEGGVMSGVADGEGAAAWGTATGSVRVVRPGRCPAAEPLPATRLSWAFGPGTRRPMASMAVSSRRLRRRALRLRPVSERVLSVIWVPMVVRKGPRVRAVLVHSHWMAKHKS
jgi:hypothetical protein